MNLSQKITITLCVSTSLLLPTYSFSNEALLQGILDTFIVEKELPGGVLFASVDGQTTIVTSGSTGIDSDTDVSEVTRFYIASSGKTLVATAILSLVQDGTIKLDDPVWPYIRDIANIDHLEHSDVVTLRQILTHTSGLSEYLDDDFYNASVEQPGKRWNAGEAISYALDEPAPADPNEVFEYTNTNYVLLGHILAHFDGSLSQSLQKRIFSPANMNNSTVGATASGLNLARGYSFELDQDVSIQAWASILGDGPVVTTAGDMGAYLSALFRDGTLLSDDLIADMTTGSKLDDSYGLGIGVDGDDWGAWYGHAGSYDGFEADFRYYPDEDAIFVFMTNGNIETEEGILDIAVDEMFSR